MIKVYEEKTPHLIVGPFLADLAGRSDSHLGNNINFAWRAEEK